MNRRSPRRGFALLDSVVAMALLAAAGVALSTANGRTDRLGRAYADRRAAVRAAEAYLAAPPPAVPPGTTVTPLPDPAPRGFRWVRVRSVVNGRAGELVGLLSAPPSAGERGTP